MIDTNVLIKLVRERKLSEFIVDRRALLSVISLWEYLRGLHSI